MLAITCPSMVLKQTKNILTSVSNALFSSNVTIAQRLQWRSVPERLGTSDDQTLFKFLVCGFPVALFSS